MVYFKWLQEVGVYTVLFWVSGDEWGRWGKILDGRGGWENTLGG